MDRSNTKERARYAAKVVSLGRERGITCIYWDEGKKYNIFSRSDGTVRYPEILRAMTDAAGL